MLIRIKKKTPSKTVRSAPASNTTQSAPELGKAPSSPVPAKAKAKPIPVPKPKTNVTAKSSNSPRSDAVLGPPPLTLKQIAAHLGVCTKTVRRIIEKKGIPHGMVGGQIRVPAEHLPLFIDKRW